MKKTIIALVATTSIGYCQLGWQPYTGQPTQTLYGSAAGAGLGYMLAPAISKGPDAQWIGALTGMAVGGLLANYMAGDNINYQQRQQQNAYNPNDYRPVRNVQQNFPLAIKAGNNTFKSPYSDFVVSTADYKPGSVVNDPTCGELFRIPR